jgi:hypothetical protein
VTKLWVDNLPLTATDESALAVFSNTTLWTKSR